MPDTDRDLVTKESSLTAVADAIRAKGGTSAELTYPDGFVSAIRAIGNYYTGATVAWNQIITNANKTAGNGETTDTRNSLYLMLRQTVSPYTSILSTQINTPGRYSYIKKVTGDSFTGIQFRHNGQQRNISFWTQSTTQIYQNHVYLFMLDVFGCDVTTVDGVSLDNTCLTDLTADFGQPIADYLYTLESNTPGAGIAKFRELFPDDYYPCQVTPVLTSFKTGDWPVNAGTELRGILTLDGEGWHRDADEYNNGVVLRKYMQADMDNVGINWRYNDTYDYFYTGDLYNNIGALKIYDSSPIGFITDAYPTGGMILSTQGPADMADGYIYQKSRDTSIGQGIILYVKDTSITSDHLNTFMTKISGKKLVIKTSSV